MLNHYYLVLTRPKAGQEDEYNHWYSKRHIFDLVAIPGVIAARRYKLRDPSTQADAGNYLAVYELSDIDLAIGGIGERRGTDRMPSSDAIDRDASKGIIFRPLWNRPPNWQFEQGLLDLVRIDDADKLVLPSPAVGYFQATEKQSRPGTPIFNYARFRTRAEANGNAPDNSELGRSGVFVSTLSTLMEPITERVSAKA